MKINIIKAGNTIQYYTYNNEIETGKVVDVEYCPDDYNPTNTVEDINVINEHGDEVFVRNDDVICII